ncbi:M3 family metallopeptidase [Caulobacter vibrioides]|nr:M3 family metallopeptidase [Caulobacter vibrioides]YP_002519189.1 peptidyl-dipeptidase DCP [Caulobacter vibrioides NA1000]ACL97281.1 peptidyl-dipeptidase DCP [Caulobacter vibrioides NA1000]ATC30502.1 M3 family peptidase [Caulobacter vibrioides]QXZ52038.1 M3 family metallopeptidase [Caulobacter vibrioides]
MQRRTFLATAAVTGAVAALQPGLALAETPNPMTQKWVGPFGGVPAFDKVKVADFKSALEAAMAKNLAEIDAITAGKAAPTFENTIAALEDAGRMLNDVQTYYYIWGSNMSTPEFQKVEAEMDPKLSAHYDKINQNAALFARIEAVYNSPDKAKLTPEQQRVLWIYYTNFVRSGAKLSPEAKARVGAINTELAGLYTKFSQNQLADENTWIELSDADLAGLPEGLKAAAASNATARKLPGKHVIVNTRSSVDPFLTESPVRAAREKVWRAFVNRGDNGGATDNNAIISKILKLRVERAKLLGYKTHAHWRLENAMAKTPENAMALMEAVWKPAIAQVAIDVADMQAIIDKEGGVFTLEPWDYRFYAEKVRKAKYDLDMNEVKPYLQLDKLREGMFWASGQLYGFEFKKLEGIPVFHEDVTVYEVTRGGKHVGLWYFDPYARPGKRSGAWMNAYRTQERFKRETTTIVSNNSNFIKGKPGEPVLISWDDAVTLFHEFGHAIHGLNANATYPSVSGTAVARDYVEFPSQLNEHWLSTPQVLNQFALHYQTGKPIPAELVKKIEAAGKFGQGFGTTEYLASALIDMKLHLAGDVDIDPDKFEREELAKLNMPKEIVMRHRTPQFGHVFSGDGYSAGYYSYLWSDTLTADAAEAFAEAPGGFYDKAVAKRLYEDIMSAGNTIDPVEQFRAFRGRDVKIGALMRKRGFPVPPGA